MTTLEINNPCAALRLLGDIVFCRARLNLIRDAECGRRIETVVRTSSVRSLFVAQCHAGEWLFIEYRNGSNAGVEFAEPLRGDLVQIAPDVVLTIMRAVEAACGWPDVIDQKRQVCKYCGLPIANSLEWELLPGGSGDWLCWNERHDGEISSQMQRYLDFLRRSYPNDSTIGQAVKQAVQSFLRDDI